MDKGSCRPAERRSTYCQWGLQSTEHLEGGFFRAGSLGRSGLDAQSLVVSAPGAVSSKVLLLCKKMKKARACALAASDSPKPDVRRDCVRLPCC